MKYKKTKAWIAFVGALATAAGVTVADDVLDLNDAIGFTSAVILATGTLYAVYKTKNKPVEPFEDGYRPTSGE